jgi:poly(A) polymerase
LSHCRIDNILSLIKKLLNAKRTNKLEKNNANKCKIISRNKHNISKTNISISALKVLNRLNKSNFDAFLVGGSVRDLLLHHTPKDFDVVTDARPNQIRKYFKNSRIIGRRFKIVHIVFGREIIEVATYRSNQLSHDSIKQDQQGMVLRDNVYGTIEEDAWRRDFTINSLYYNISDSSILDFTSGYEDILNKTIRIIGDAEKRYTEDPVRMLRAIRFAAKLGFEICPQTAKPIAKLSHLLLNVSNSRMFDEVVKLYHCGSSVRLNNLLHQHQLFYYLFPQLNDIPEQKYPVNELILNALENTDQRLKEGKNITPAFLFAVFLWFPLLEQAEELQEQGYPPLTALEKSMGIILAKQQKTTSIPRRYSQVIREIWLLQFRLPKRYGIRPFKVLEHPRFRAAYDFMVLRALVGDEDIELAHWWTDFQEETPANQRAMINKIKKKK